MFSGHRSYGLRSHGLRRYRHRRLYLKDGGFSLVELALVVLIIGLVASIMIPNLLNALQKAKQRATMAELRLTGMAWMSWLTDQAGGAAAGAGQTYSVTGFRALSYGEIYGYLHPSQTFFYMQEVPASDAWGSQLTFYQNPDVASDHQLLLCAAARGDVFETCDGTTDIPIGPFLGTDFDQDIVWADGFLVRWPDVVDSAAN